MAEWETSREPLAWFRPAIRGLVVRAWAQAFGLVLLGAGVLGGLRVERIDFGSPWLALYIVGLLLVVSGPLWLATRLSRLMRQERCLSLERDALVWLEGDHPRTTIPWIDIEGIELEGESLIIIMDRRRLELPARFEDIAPETLVSTLLDLRRRALMGLPMRIALQR